MCRNNKIVVGDDRVLQRVAPGDLHIDRAIWAGGGSGDGVAGNQHVIPDIARRGCHRRAAVWTDIDCVRHHQVADGGVREGRPGGHGPRPKTPGSGRIPELDTGHPTALKSKPIESVAPGHDIKRQVRGCAGERDVRLPVAVNVTIDRDVAPAEGLQSLGRWGVDHDSGTLQRRRELDVPCAGIVVRGDDCFLERNSVRAGIGHERLHRRRVAIDRHRGIGDSDHRAAIEDHWRNDHGGRRIAFCADRAAIGRQGVRKCRVCSDRQ